MRLAFEVSPKSEYLALSESTGDVSIDSLNLELKTTSDCSADIDVGSNTIAVIFGIV